MCSLEIVNSIFVSDKSGDETDFQTNPSFSTKCKICTLKRFRKQFDHSHKLKIHHDAHLNKIHSKLMLRLHSKIAVTEMFYEDK